MRKFALLTTLTIITACGPGGSSEGHSPSPTPSTEEATPRAQPTPTPSPQPYANPDPQPAQCTPAAVRSALVGTPWTAWYSTDGTTQCSAGFGCIFVTFLFFEDGTYRQDVVTTTDWGTGESFRELKFKGRYDMDCGQIALTSCDGQHAMLPLTTFSDEGWQSGVYIFRPSSFSEAQWVSDAEFSVVQGC